MRAFSITTGCMAKQCLMRRCVNFSAGLEINVCRRLEKYFPAKLPPEGRSESISSLKSFLHSQFHTKDLGMLKYFLVVEVMRSKQLILLSQRKYVLNMSFETGKLGAKPCSTSMAPNVQLTKEGELFEDPERYKRLVGKLNYLTVTLPNIVYSVSVLSDYMSSPTVSPMLFERSSWTWNIV